MKLAPNSSEPARAAAGFQERMQCTPMAQKEQQRHWLQTAAPWLAAFALVLNLHAGPRSSTSYTVPTDSVDAAGSHATSGSYSSDGSLGGITGIATVAAPAETARSGYIGQLYQVTALQLAAAPTTINESGTRQLGAAQVLDDGSTLTLAAASVTWSVQSGPLTGISSSAHRLNGFVKLIGQTDRADLAALTPCAARRQADKVELRGTPR